MCSGSKDIIAKTPRDMLATTYDSDAVDKLATILREENAFFVSICPYDVKVLGKCVGGTEIIVISKTYLLCR